MNSAPSYTDKKNPGVVVGLMIAYLAVGAAVGNIGFLGYLFKYINNVKVRNVC